MEVSYSNDTAFKVGHFGWIGLVEHTLVAVARSSGLTCIDSGDNDDLVLDLVLNSAQTVDIIENAVLVVSRAGTDDKQELIGFTAENLLYFSVTVVLDFCKIGSKRMSRFDFAWGGSSLIIFIAMI